MARARTTAECVDAGRIEPFSRGRVRLDPADPAGPAHITFDFRADPRDRARHADAVRRAAAMLLAPEVRPLWRTAFPVARTDRLRRLNDVTAYNALRARAIAAVLDLLPAASRPVIGTMSQPGIDVARMLTDS